MFLAQLTSHSHYTYTAHSITTDPALEVFLQTLITHLYTNSTYTPHSNITYLLVEPSFIYQSCSSRLYTCTISIHTTRPPIEPSSICLLNTSRTYTIMCITQGGNRRIFKTLLHTQITLHYDNSSNRISTPSHLQHMNITPYHNRKNHPRIHF